jgi:hypothetical protein
MQQYEDFLGNSGAFPAPRAGNRAIRLYLFAAGKKDTAPIPCAEKEEFKRLLFRN